MDSKVVLVLLGLCAVIAVTEGIKCYKCQRMELLDLKWGLTDKDKASCEYPVVEEAPESGNDCSACFTDTRDDNFDWVERGCIPVGTNCVEGEAEHDTPLPGTGWLDKIPGFKEGVKFDSERKCCTTDLCNNDWFNPDGATTAQLSASLFVAVVAAIFYNLRQ